MASRRRADGGVDPSQDAVEDQRGEGEDQDNGDVESGGLGEGGGRDR